MKKVRIAMNEKRLELQWMKKVRIAMNEKRLELQWKKVRIAMKKG